MAKTIYKKRCANCGWIAVATGEEEAKLAMRDHAGVARTDGNKCTLDLRRISKES